MVSNYLFQYPPPATMENANNPQAPEIYTFEKDAFPPSVAQVPTAIPAFVGYTETAVRQGKSLLNTPVLINSLHEYVEYFGGAPEYKFPIHPVTNTTDPTQPPKPEDYDFAIGPHYYKIGAGQEALFYLYNSLRLFYLNGGGPAYVVSIGNYMEASFTTTGTVPHKKTVKSMKVAVVDRDKLMAGLNLLPTIPFPKPTMILIPDLMALEKAEDCYVVQQQMIAQAGGLKDRMAMLDIYDGWQATDSGVISNFRNNMGVSDLDYAISYYPWLECAVVDAAEVSYANLYTPASGSTDPVDINSILKGLPLLKKLSQVNGDMDTLKGGVLTPALKLGKNPAIDATTYDSWTQAFNSSPNSESQEIIVDQGKVLYSMYQVIYELGNSATVSDDLPTPVSITKESDLQTAIQLLTNPNGPSAALMVELYNYESNFPNISPGAFTQASLASVGVAITTTGDNPSPYPTGTTSDAAYEIAEPVYKKALSQFTALISGMISDAKTLLMQYNTSLENSNKDYNHIMSSVAKQANILPPTAAMAGVYTLVDNTEGVWHAPANRNIDAVVAPMVAINDDQQAPLNVDALAGKSINVIRSFYGRGPAMVWGARTMAGNSLDYKYINVRRLMIMIEQSVANAAFSLVFLPNDASTWSICEAMISNFLANIWSEGALQGAKASDAFSVMIGLGKTMTPLDVLNGIMRIQVKVAAVHPAEFIIITYEQEMAKS